LRSLRKFCGIAVQSEFVMGSSLKELDQGKPAQWFSGWEAVLAQEETRAEPRAWTREIVGRFLADCAGRGEPVSVAAARAFLDREILRWRPDPRELEGWKSGLNWFFREGKRRRQAALAQVPALTRSDQGQTEEQESHATRAATQCCDASARKRDGHSDRAGAIRAQGRCDNANLHPRHTETGSGRPQPIGWVAMNRARRPSLVSVWFFSLRSSGGKRSVGSPKTGH